MMETNTVERKKQVHVRKPIPDEIWKIFIEATHSFSDDFFADGRNQWGDGRDENLS